MTPVSDAATTFPTRSPDVGQYVLEYVQDLAVEGLADGAPALSFYADPAQSVAEQKAIAVVPDWPVYPGEVPVLGVARGPQPAGSSSSGAGVLAGEVVAVDEATGIPYASATYYVHAQSAEIVVELLHDDRGERDRLHDALQRGLAPLGRVLQQRDPLVRDVTVTGRKRELEPEAPASVVPATLHLSVFSVLVNYELLEAHDVGGPDSVSERVEVSVTVTDSTA